jgi:hypothetical protein
MTQFGQHMTSDHQQQLNRITLRLNVRLIGCGVLCIVAGFLLLGDELGRHPSFFQTAWRGTALILLGFFLAVLTANDMSIDRKIVVWMWIPLGICLALILIASVAVLNGSVHQQLESQRVLQQEQLRAIKRIEALGGSATGIILDEGSPPQPEYVFLTELEPGVTDDDVALISTFAKLRVLKISSRQLTDDGVRRITRHSRLEHLTLECPKITDDGIAALAELNQLRQLNLRGSQLTDRGAKLIFSRLVTLEHLDLGETALTDSCLAEIAALKRLKELRIDQTQITADGVRDLQARLPHCRIE